MLPDPHRIRTLFRSAKVAPTGDTEQGSPDGARLFYLSADRLIPNRSQPRTDFTPAALERLADSIRIHGILQPLTVRLFDDPHAEQGRERYEIVAGERRFRAAQMVGLLQIPCILCDADDPHAAELALVENLLREDLNPFDQACGIRLLIDVHGMSRETIAQRLSLNVSTVANKLRLLQFSEEERQTILSAGLSERHARALLRLTDPDLRREAMLQIIRSRLNVAATDAYVEQLLNPPPARAVAAPQDAFHSRLQRIVSDLRKSGTAVESEQEETADAYIIRIRVPKPRT